MPEYCSSGDVIKRLTQIGYQWVADRDQSGGVNSTERSWNVEEPIVWAGTKVDAAIVDQVLIGSARASGNLYLKHLCKDIAVWYCYTQGGRSAPEAVLLAYQMAMTELTRLTDGGLIPGFVYPSPVNAYTISRTPKVKNWSTNCGCGQVRR